MKKLVSIVLLCAMLVSCFAGCGMQKGAIDLNVYAGDANVSNTAYTDPGFTTSIDTSGDPYHPTNNPTGTYSVYSGTKDKDWYDPDNLQTEYVLETADQLMGFFDLLNGAVNSTVVLQGFGATSNGTTTAITQVAQNPFAVYEKENGVIKADANGNPVIASQITVKLARHMIINQLDAGLTSVDSLDDFQTSYATTQIAGNGTRFFSGIFDGNGKIISGLYQKPTSNNRSLFGPLYGGTIKNLTIIDSLWDCNGKASAALSIWSYGDCTISNVYSEFYMIGGPTSDAGQSGFVGEVKSGSLTIENCVNATTIASATKAFVAGFVGRTVLQSYTPTGGTKISAPAITAITINNCLNAGNINTASGTAAGFVGLCNAGSLTITNCNNTGNVVTTQTDNRADFSYDDRYIAAFVGCFNNTGDTGILSMSGCVNSGNISGEGYTAALLGGGSAKTISMTDCSSSGNVTYTGGQSGGLMGNVNGTITLTNCSASGTISIPENATMRPANNLIGGLIGQVDGSKALTLKNCTFSGTVKGNRCTAGLVGAAHSTGTLTVDSCTVSGTVLGEMNAEKNLSVGGLIGNLRSNKTTIKNSTFSGTLNVDFQTVPSGTAAKNGPCAAGAIVGGFSDYTSAGKLLMMLGNTVSGSMKVTNSDADTTYGHYAGIFLGYSNGLSRVEYIGNNTISETFSIDTNSNVEIYKGGAIGGDMIQVEGYQISAKNTANNTYNLRFVASTRGEYDALGFVVGVKYTDGEGNVHEKLRTAYASTLYTSIYGGDDKDGNPIEYAASDYNQKYLYTLEIRNVPAAYVEADTQTFGITLLPFGVNKETVESETTVTNFPGVPATYGTLPTAKAEEDLALENVGSYTTLNALYGKDAALVAAPSLTIGKDDYKNNLYFGIDSANGGTDYCVYPSTNEPYTASTVKNVSFMTYTVTGIEEGTYDLVLKLRVKNDSARRVIMYLNDGQDAYLVGYATEDVKGFSTTEAENSYYVKVGTFTFGEGDTITFKIDSSWGSAMHLRGMYLMTEADFTEAPAAEE